MNDEYTAARLHGMRAKLITEYERLLKMSDSEVVNFLQGTAYKRDIETLSITDLSDVGVIDKILAANEKRILKKLDLISSKKFKKALASRLEENDLWNLRVIAEALTAGEDPKEALDKYERWGTKEPRQFADVKSIADLASKVGVSATDLDGFTRALRYYNPDVHRAAFALPNFVRRHFAE